MSKPINYQGQKFGRLTAVSFTGRHSQTSGGNKKRIWHFRCECGKECDKVMEKVVKGWTKSCGCLKTTRTPLQRLQLAVWSDYRSDTDMSEEQFIKLSQEPCYLCGAPPSNIRKGRYNKNSTWAYNGLDRIDNEKNHNLDNVKSCCWRCNDLRSNVKLTDFLNHIKRIYLHTFGETIANETRELYTYAIERDFAGCGGEPVAQ